MLLTVTILCSCLLLLLVFSPGPGAYIKPQSKIVLLTSEVKKQLDQKAARKHVQIAAQLQNQVATSFSAPTTASASASLAAITGASILSDSLKPLITHNHSSVSRPAVEHFDNHPFASTAQRFPAQANHDIPGPGMYYLYYCCLVHAVVSS